MANSQGSDGYHQSWEGYGNVYSGPVHNQKARGSTVVDYLQVQDLMTGEIAYFRFPCGDGAIDANPPVATEGMPPALCFDDNGEGYRKETGGTIELSKINGKGGLKEFYYLNIMGEVGHELKVILEGEDGYKKSWSGYGDVWTDGIHQNDGKRSTRKASRDFLQVQDLMTGEISYFEWPCRGAKKHRTGSGQENNFPPQCPIQHVGHSTDQCFGAGEDCALCMNKNSYCKPTGGSISVSRVDGIGGLADYYYLNIMGEVGHELKVILESEEGYHRSWQEFGSVWSDKIHKPGTSGRKAGEVDHLQVQDLQTGEIAFFSLPCVEEVPNPFKNGKAKIASPAPAPPPPAAVARKIDAPLIDAPLVPIAGKIDAPPGPPGPPGSPGEPGEISIKGTCVKTLILQYCCNIVKFVIL